MTKSKSKVVILYCDLLGDYLLFRNYLVALRRQPALQDKEIIFIGNEAIKPLAMMLDKAAADQWIWIPSYTPWVLTPKKLLKLPLLYWPRRQQLKAMEVPLVVDALWCPSTAPWVTNLIALLIQSMVKVGKDVEDKKFHALQAWLYSTLYRPSRFNEFIFFQHGQFFQKALGAVFEEVTLTFPREKFFGLFQKRPLVHPYCVVFPDSAESFKEWPPQHFAAFVKHIRQTWGLQVYLCGHERKKHLGDQIVQQAGVDGVINMMGETTLLDAFDVIGQSRFVVCNDSFALHAANAMQVPLFCLTQGLYYGRYLPYPETLRLSSHEYVFTDNPSQPLASLSPEMAQQRLSHWWESQQGV